MRTWLADRLMPIVARNATVWPSTHAQHAGLLEQIRELEAENRRSKAALVHIANTTEWIDDDPAERVAYLQGVARDAVHTRRR